MRSDTHPTTVSPPPTIPAGPKEHKLSSGQRLGAGTVLAGAAFVLAMLAFRHPSGWVPACPTQAYLGLFCPGCGSTRATHFLLNLSFGDAIAHNPLLVLIGVPLGVWYAAELVSVVVRGTRLRPVIVSPRVAWIAFGVVLAFGLVRNVPGALFDRLRPPDQIGSPLDTTFNTETDEATAASVDG